MNCRTLAFLYKYRIQSFWNSFYSRTLVGPWRPVPHVVIYLTTGSSQDLQDFFWRNLIGHFIKYVFKPIRQCLENATTEIQAVRISWVLDKRLENTAWESSIKGDEIVVGKRLESLWRVAWGSELKRSRHFRRNNWIEWYLLGCRAGCGSVDLHLKDGWETRKEFSARLCFFNTNFRQCK